MAFINNYLFILFFLIYTPSLLAMKRPHEDITAIQQAVTQAIQQSNIPLLDDLVRNYNYPLEHVAHAAINLNRVDVIKHLIKNHNYLNQTLYLAISQNNTVVVNDIIKSFNALGNAVFMALQQGSINYVDYFINNYNCPINHQDGEGRTMLHIAAIHGHFRLAEYLVKQGADVSIQDKSGRIAEHHSKLNYNNADLTSYLVDRRLDQEKKARNEVFLKATNEEKIRQNKMYFMNAAGGGNIASVKKYLTQNYDINEEYLGHTPLANAVEKDKNEMVDFLLKNNANPDLANNVGTPLEIAATNHNKAIIKILLDKKATVDLIGVRNRPLMLAIESKKGDSLGTVKLLIEAQACVNGIKDSGVGKYESPLNLACSLNECAIIELLLTHKADPNLGKSAPLYYAAEYPSINAIKLLCDHKAHVNHMNAKGITPLLAVIYARDIYPDHITGRYAKYDCAEYLINQGAYTNKTDQQNNSPLLFAIIQKPIIQQESNLALSIVNLLIDNGANPDADPAELNQLVHHASCQQFMAVILKRSVQGNVVPPQDNNKLAMFSQTIEQLKNIRISNEANLPDQNLTMSDIKNQWFYVADNIKNGFRPQLQATKNNILKVAVQYLDADIAEELFAQQAYLEKEEVNNNFIYACFIRQNARLGAVIIKLGLMNGYLIKDFFQSAKNFHDRAGDEHVKKFSRGIGRKMARIKDIIGPDSSLSQGAFHAAMLPYEVRMLIAIFTL